MSRSRQSICLDPNLIIDIVGGREGTRERKREKEREKGREKGRARGRERWRVCVYEEIVSLYS